MEKIRKFEEQIWELIATATEKKDSVNLGQLTSVIDDIKRLKVKASKIEAVVDKLEDRVKKLGIKLPAAQAVKSAAQAVKSVSWPVSHSDIIDNALSVEEAIDAGLIPINGKKFVVQTSLGQVFKTDVVSEEKRLSEQYKVGEFYRGEGIKAGEKIVWTKIAPDRYSLERAA